MVVQKKSIQDSLLYSGKMSANKNKCRINTALIFIRNHNRKRFKLLITSVLILF